MIVLEDARIYKMIRVKDILIILYADGVRIVNVK